MAGSVLISARNGLARCDPTIFAGWLLYPSEASARGSVFGIGTSNSFPWRSNLPTVAKVTIVASTVKKRSSHRDMTVLLTGITSLVPIGAGCCFERLRCVTFAEPGSITYTLTSGHQATNVVAVHQSGVDECNCDGWASFDHPRQFAKSRRLRCVRQSSSKDHAACSRGCITLTAGRPKRAEVNRWEPDPRLAPWRESRMA